MAWVFVGSSSLLNQLYAQEWAELGESSEESVTVAFISPLADSRVGEKLLKCRLRATACVSRKDYSAPKQRYQLHMGLS